MSDGFWIVVLIIIAITVYTLGKVISYMRQSDRQWKQVDKTKLKEWDDDDDW